MVENVFITQIEVFGSGINYQKKCTGNRWGRIL
mgnify:CR=1 FL=1